MKNFKILFMSFIAIFLVSLIIILGCEKTTTQDYIIWEGLNTVNTDTLYKNPVFEPDFADPTVIQGTDGIFYAFGTQNTWANGVNRIAPVITSKDLVNWTYLTDAFEKSEEPSWHDGYLWALEARYIKGKYYLFYSLSIWGDNNPGIGVAMATTPEGPYEDLGKILDSKSSGVVNSIDPFVWTESGRIYLFWGSFAGIYGIELSSDLTTTVGEKFQVTGNLFEGTTIFKKDGEYFFIGSNGSCCDGLSSSYNLRVGKASDIKGPYYAKDGNPLLNSRGTLLLEGSKETGFVGPGHNSQIITDDNGDDWLIYHAIDVDQPYLWDGITTRRPLMIDKIIWKDGWPTIENGVPSNTWKTKPVFGD